MGSGVKEQVEFELDSPRLDKERSWSKSNFLICRRSSLCLDVCTFGDPIHM